MLVSPPELVIRTLATFADSFQDSRVVWPASIVEGEAIKLLTLGVRVILTSTDALVGVGGEAGVHEPDRIAVNVYVESAVGVTIMDPVVVGKL